MAVTSGRSNGRRDAEASTTLKAHARAHALPCWLCGQPIDFTADWLDPNCFQLDHVKAVSTHPHLRHEPTNHRPSHRSCNNRRKGNDPAPTLGVTTRRWGPRP